MVYTLSANKNDLISSTNDTVIANATAIKVADNKALTLQEAEDMIGSDLSKATKFTYKLSDTYDIITTIGQVGNVKKVVYDNASSRTLTLVQSPN